ncbi:hypothetical protein M430DRAFT_36692 [Amorphotheca resinae ATCC 22711]|uniref:Uncharacterized protein n=1 Tax=Amorphotheca resinae ATCC 22711 TaxID=857342 RepID=A0A2T3AVA7_AMORE|nr:hypothetical protein M430DRAFT_36692 [Amorphotheca resinae ATCC 22711]PSS12610.1 hypothetical protein M430DRAFT_36692 [Amorphotheca resinae ATCC 22711]
MHGKAHRMHGSKVDLRKTAGRCGKEHARRDAHKNRDNRDRKTNKSMSRREQMPNRKPFPNPQKCMTRRSS